MKGLTPMLDYLRDDRPVPYRHLATTRPLHRIDLHTTNHTQYTTSDNHLRHKPSRLHIHCKLTPLQLGSEASPGITVPFSIAAW